MDKVLDRRLDEEYNLLKPYINDRKCCGELHKMCNKCEQFLGADEHNYEDCKDMECFKFYLAYSSLHRFIGYEMFD